MQVEDLLSQPLAGFDWREREGKNEDPGKAEQRYGTDPDPSPRHPQSLGLPTLAGITRQPPR